MIDAHNDFFNEFEINYLTCVMSSIIHDVFQLNLKWCCDEQINENKFY